MGHVQNVVLADGLETLDGQGHHFVDVVQIHLTDALQAGLHDLLEGAVSLAGAVDVLVIIDLPGTGLLLPGVFHDGDGHVGLQGHEDPPGIGEGDHPVADEEVLVPDVQIVLLELAHLEPAVAVLLI